MKVAVHTNGAAHQTDAAAAIARGLARHGIDTVMATAGGAVKGDFDVCWGWRIGAPLRAAGRNVLVMERGYVGNIDERRRWTSLAWNGLNGRGRTPAASDGGARWRKHFGTRMQPWRETGADVIVMGQVAGDAAIEGVDMGAWYRAALTAARRFDLPVAFRAHPSALKLGLDTPVPRGTPMVRATLEQALRHARFVITFNSNSATDAVLAGIPTLACDEGSIAWLVCGHGLDADPPSPDRTRWAADLAWRQWTADEIESGAAWEFVRHGLDDRHQAAG